MLYQSIQYRKYSLMVLAITVMLLFSCAPPGRAEIDASGLVGHYVFSGNAMDASSVDNHGTANGVVSTTDRDGIANSAYQFDGQDDYILIPNSASLDISNFQNGYTLAAWIFPDDVFLYYRDIVSKGNNGFSIRLNKNILEACHHNVNSTGCQTSNIRISQREWSHIAVTWDQSTGKWQMYHNGNPANYTGNMQTLITNNDGNVAIGKDPWYDRWYFDGKIDDVRIYNRELQASEIRQLAAPVCVPKTCADISPACGSGLDDGCGGTIDCTCEEPEANAVAVEITSGDVTLRVGENVLVMAEAAYDDGTTSNVSNSATFVSSNPNVVSVANNIVKGESAGTAQLHATYEGIDSSPINVEVTEEVVVRIIIDTGDVSLWAGESITLTTMAEYTSGAMMDVSLRANYSIGNSYIAMLSNKLLIGNHGGTTSLTASFDGVESDPVTIQVTEIQSIQVSPNPVILTETNPQESIQVFGTDHDGIQHDITEHDFTYYQPSLPGIYSLEMDSGGLYTNQISFISRGSSRLSVRFEHSFALVGPEEVKLCNQPPSNNMIEAVPTSPQTVFVKQVVA